MPEWLPFVIGFALVVQFVALAGWQISRGLEKRAEQHLFSSDAGFTAWTPGMEVRPYQRLRVQGQFDPEHQFLLDNIILNSRYGYYVLTPLVLNAENDVLLVNRGWIEKATTGVAPVLPEIDTATATVHGRAGSLPRAGYKMGAAVSPGSAWPKLAVYPTLAEISAELGLTVQPFVLLLEPDDERGFVRHWVPEEMGPGRHFAYALQWFAMGGVLAALLAWHWRRRRAGQRGARD
jgi:surfeit locus 1 family protein